MSPGPHATHIRFAMKTAGILICWDARPVYKFVFPVGGLHSFEVFKKALEIDLIHSTSLQDGASTEVAGYASQSPPQRVKSVGLRQQHQQREQAGTQ